MGQIQLNSFRTDPRRHLPHTIVMTGSSNGRSSKWKQVRTFDIVIRQVVAKVTAIGFNNKTTTACKYVEEVYLVQVCGLEQQSAGRRVL